MPCLTLTEVGTKKAACAAFYLVFPQSFDFGGGFVIPCLALTEVGFC